MLLEQDGTRLLFDPFISINKSLYSPSIEELSASKHVFVTHGHYDHINAIPEIINHGTPGTMVYCTDKPFETLANKGVEKSSLHKIVPGDCFSIEPFEVRVLKGKHIVFDKRLLIKTLLSPRMLLMWKNFKQILKDSKGCDEAGETVVYDIRTEDKRILLMGSLNLDDDTQYPTGADLLVLPLQGRSDISQYALNFIPRLQPKKLMLDHFDDSFPPISSAVNTAEFVRNMQQRYPNIPVICPPANDQWLQL